jgi:hypothetical protein
VIEKILRGDRRDGLIETHGHLSALLFAGASPGLSTCPVSFNRREMADELSSH